MLQKRMLYVHMYVCADYEKDEYIAVQTLPLNNFFFLR